MADVLSQTLEIQVGEADAVESFTLRVPTPIDRVRMGVREAGIRRMFDPGGQGWAAGLDDEVFFMVKGMAVLETLLEKSSSQWPYTEFKPERGEPELRIDITKFPPGKEEVIAEVGRKFGDALARFHRERVGHT
jgi:hypothetical protein